MRIESPEPFTDKFVIAKGNTCVLYFNFFIDGNRASWTRWAWAAQKFTSRNDAEIILEKIAQLGE